MTTATVTAPHVSQDAHHITLTGVLTMQTAGAAFRALAPLPRGGSIVIDASGVTQADSSALALITSLMRQAHAQGVYVRLMPLPPALASVTHIYGLHDILSSYSS
jgi:phospholipid transport system transporter-binding protein